MNGETCTELPEFRGGVAIVGHGLSCAAGNQPFALLGAVAGGLSLARADRALEVPTPDGRGGVPLVSCPVLAHHPDPGSRLAALWWPALGQVLATAPWRRGDEGRCEVTLAVPATAWGRDGCVDPGTWCRQIRAAFDWPAETTVRVVPAEGTVVGELALAAGRLREGLCDRVLFGAVDTLLEPGRLDELAAGYRLAGRSAGGGIVPGEAAAFVALERAEGSPPHAVRLEAAVTAAEPGHGRAGETRLAGLAQAIEGVARLAGSQPQALECLCAGVSDPLDWPLEWQQAGSRLWPRRLPEADRRAMEEGRTDAPQPPPGPQRELLDPATAVGHTGIAAPMLALLLACARLAFDWPAPRQVAVLDQPDTPFRGALWATAPGAAGAGRKPHGRGPGQARGRRSRSGA